MRVYLSIHILYYSVYYVNIFIMINTEKETDIRRLTRRDFLKGTGYLAFWLLLTSIEGSRGIETEKDLTQIPPPAMIDFYVPTPDRLLFSTSTPVDNSRFVKGVLGDKYRNFLQLFREFGPPLLFHPEQRAEMVFNNHPELAFVLGFINSGQHHGINVAQAMKTTRKSFGYSFIPELYPWQKAYRDLKIFQTDIGNWACTVEIDPEAIHDFLSSSSCEIVNLSLQFGEVRVEAQMFEKRYAEISIIPYIYDATTYHYVVLGRENYTFKERDGLPPILVTEEGKHVNPLNPKKYKEFKQKIEPTLYEVVKLDDIFIRFLEAYNANIVDTNFGEFRRACSQHPDRFFCTAAGSGYNPNDLRSITPETRPINSLVIAAWSEGSPRGCVYGPDLYVDTKPFGILPAGSYATPIITTVATILRYHGVRINDIRQMVLDEFCTPVTYQVFNPQTKQFEPERSRLFSQEAFLEFTRSKVN